MTITYVGSLSIGEAIPGAAAVAVAGVAGINGALPDIQARLDALAAFVPTPVDFAAQLLLAQQMVVSVTSAIALGIPAPSIAVQIATVLALVLALEATVAAVSANLDLIIDFQSLLTASGIHVYAFSGNTEDLGGELTTELAGGVPGGGPTDAANALVLVTTIGATWTAMGQVFQVTP